MRTSRAMIAFGCPIADEALYRRSAATSIAALAEADSLILEKRGYDSICQPYNEILAEAGARDDLEAVVLMHQDTEIDEPRFVELVRHRFADPRVGLIGATGARACPPAANWWVGDVVGAVTVASLDQDWYGRRGVHYADVADGYLLVVSAQVARTVRFNEELNGHFHGYDVDFSFRVRAGGHLIVIDDFANTHWSPGVGPHDPRWLNAATVIRRIWNPAFWPPEWRGSAPYGFFSGTDATD
jgi:hypothetical protein